MKFVNAMGFRVFSDSLDKIKIHDGKCRVINCISPNQYTISKKDAEYDYALKKTDFLVLDGVYFAIAPLLFRLKWIKSNHGPFVFDNLMKRINQTGGKVFFLGSSENVLERIKYNASQNFSKIEVGTYSPPFKKEFSEDENCQMVNAINSFKPDVVFVGMTAPKQEKWAIKNRDLLDVGLIASVGNVFDWFAGTQKSIPPFFLKIGLGWLIRIFLRPEIFKRNIGNQLHFLWDVLLVFIRVKKEPIYQEIK